METAETKGFASQKWTTNRKHFEPSYTSNLNASEDVCFKGKKIIEVPKTGKPIIEKPSIKVTIK